MAVTKLVLVRHGESQWNQENRFTGWYDVDLSDKGRTEAKAAGQLLKKEGFVFDFAYTSVLKRAIHTLWNVLDELDQAWLPGTKPFCRALKAVRKLSLPHTVTRCARW